MPPGRALTNGEWVYIPIPKNASSSIKEVLGWKENDFHTFTCHTPAFAVIRNPVDRWFSGINQYAVRYDDANYGRILANVKEGGYPVYDEHTMRQTDYLLSTFRYLDLVRFENVNEYMAEKFDVELPRANVREWQPDPDLVPIIKDFYADDVALYESL